MLRYIIRRLLYAIPIVLGVLLVTFLLFFVVTPREQMARRNISAKDPSPEQINDWLKTHGYDKPMPELFRKHVVELMTLQFGKSDTSEEQIWDKLKAGIGPSLLIASLVFASALIVDILLAIFFAYFRGTYLDAAGTFLMVLLMSISYLVYLIAGQYLLAKILKFFPLAGYQSGLMALKFAAMPMVVGVVSGLGASVRLYRTFLLEETNQDYVRTARAKGVPEERILVDHVLKNASIPILTTVVMQIPFLLMGSILLESFFSIPGLGTMTFDAINSQDFAVLRAMVFLGSLAYILGALLTDISYALADPRVRLE